MQYWCDRIWMGVELEQPIGKNDGSVGGEQYFTSKPKHGVFAPESRVTKYKQLHKLVKSHH